MDLSRKEKLYKEVTHKYYTNISTPSEGGLPKEVSVEPLQFKEDDSFTDEDILEIPTDDRSGSVMGEAFRCY